MTKIAILGDTHFGARADSKVLLDYQQEFFDDLFFPTLEERGIGHIVHLGDLCDRRKYVNFHTLSRFRGFFLDRLGGYETHVICGNHDVFFKSTNRVNALDEICASLGVNVHTHPKTETVAGTRFAVLPWMNRENQDAWSEVLTTSDAPYCLGHLEINGFPKTLGHECDDGWKPSVFGRFDRVLSGHFHVRSEKKNILYVGTPYELSWNDHGTRKGFHVLDSETGETEFVEFERKLFHKVYVDEEETDVDSLLGVMSPRDYRGAFVKVYVSNRRTGRPANRIVQYLEEICSPSDVQVIESSTLDANAEGSKLTSMDDTLTLVKKAVDARTDLPAKKKSHLKKFLATVYEEAQNLER